MQTEQITSIGPFGYLICEAINLEHSNAQKFPILQACQSLKVHTGL